MRGATNAMALHALIITDTSYRDVTLDNTRLGILIGNTTQRIVPVNPSYVGTSHGTLLGTLKHKSTSDV